MKRWTTMLLLLVCLGGCDGEERCGERCTEGVSCAEVRDVPSDFSLEEAAATAAPGTCIALAPGTYGEVTLSAGVRLLGAGASEVTVGSVTIEAGANAQLRGLHVAGVVKVRPDAVDVLMDRLLVTGSKNGVQAERGSSFTLQASELVGVPDNGILALDAASLTVRDTRIVGSGGPGIWVQCSDGCECETPPSVDLARVELRSNHLVGVAFHGVSARLEDVLVAETLAAGFEYGGGVTAAACSDLTARALTVDGMDSFGVLVSGSSATLGSSDDDKGIIIVNNKGGGVWLQDIASSVTMENATLTGNLVAGLDIGAGSKGIIIVNNHVGSTALAPTPALQFVDGAWVAVANETIGDGIIWGDGAQVAIDGLTVGGSGRNSILIDGPVAAGSALANVTLESGDELKGILQQRAGQASEAPSIDNAPAPMQTLASPHALPQAPLPPQALASGS
jgi:hypothetical protein